MNSKTLNRLLYAIMALLVIIICFLLYKIVNRPRLNSEQAATSTTIEEVSLSEITNTVESATVTDTIDEASQTEVTETTTESEESIAAENDTMQGKVSTKVNIREQADSESRILETVEEGYSFEILEILPEGWVKIAYGDGIGYISSQYVIITNQ